MSLGQWLWLEFKTYSIIVWLNRWHGLGVALCGVTLEILQRAGGQLLPACPWRISGIRQYLQAISR